MSKLIIIGNGFDRAHDMKTTYWDFRDFIEIRYPEILEVLEHYSLRSKETLWNDFENSLSKLDIDRLRDNSLIATIRGRNDDDYYSGEDEGVGYFLNEEIGFIYQWSDLILEWVSDYIVLPEDKVFQKSILNDDNYFFSFNYTDTLEYTYGIDDNRVRHIHGRAGYNEDLVMGHRNDALLKELNNNQVDYALQQKESSLMESVLNYMKASYKDVSSIIKSWKVYLEEYKNVNEIHIIGWSVNKIDLPYLDLIIELVPSNIPMYIYYYNLEAKRVFEVDLSEYIKKYNLILLDIQKIKK
jgi:hypothetical protein